MDTTIRNLDERAYDERAYKELRARAVLEERTVGEVINEAIQGYLARPTPGKGSLRALKPKPFPPGNDNLSSEIDQIVCGNSR